MIEMTQNINQNWAAQCSGQRGGGSDLVYTCHRGEPVPNNIWFRVGPVNNNAAGWPAIQNRVTMTSNFTSLPSTYLEHFLLQDEDGFYGVAQVHDLASRVENLEGDPLIQQAEMTYAWMNYFSNSLGVNCVFCHNSRAFYGPNAGHAAMVDRKPRHHHGAGAAGDNTSCRSKTFFRPNASARSTPMCRSSPAAPATRASRQPLNGLNVIAQLAGAGRPRRRARLLGLRVRRWGP